MKRWLSIGWLFVLVGALLACADPTPMPTGTALPTAVSLRERSATETQAADYFTFSGTGPYLAGSRDFTYVDQQRGDSEINVTVVYPALEQLTERGNHREANAQPDLSGAPYPVILVESNSGEYLFKSHLASHGFVMVVVHYTDYADEWGMQVVNHPKDMLFVLDQISTEAPEGLEGMLDTDQVGVAGYSSDGDAALMLSGARVNPENYHEQCESAPKMEPKLPDLWVGWVCNLADQWDAFEMEAGEGIAVSDDGLWQPVTDERIRAVMPMAAGGAWMFGEQGLAAVDRPAFILAGTKDDIVPYQTESVFIYEHLGVEEKYMVSFVGEDHMMVFDPAQTLRINHFAVAFFGYYLQGHEDYRDQFSAAFVSQAANLAWGAYSEE
ncbi:MAG: hypothetical protein JW750_00910 [Anaerolineaceae bacterium]|nr:hypothetical protein [Anaerolineaceae bacterium]